MNLGEAIKTALEYEAGVYMLYHDAIDKTNDPTANGFGADRRALRVLLDHLPVFVYHSRLEADAAVLEFVSDGVQTVTGYPVFTPLLWKDTLP